MKNCLSGNVRKVSHVAVLNFAKCPIRLLPTLKNTHVSRSTKSLQYFMPFVLGVADLGAGLISYSQNETPSAVLPFQFIERAFYFSNFFFAYIRIVYNSQIKFKN